MKKDFLLTTELAARLYHDCAAELPVIDYHNHLSVSDIRENRRFGNLYELWIEPDPYKHRAMRMCGIPERCITGEAQAEEKFACWCSIFPKLVGSPLYQWSLMELRDVLEIREIPKEENWKLIWQHGESYMERNVVSAESILKQYRTEYASPCASILDSLAVYEGKEDIAPSLRGDGILYPDRSFLKKLEGLTGVKIVRLDSYFQALSVRLEAFCQAGCRFADHSLDNGFVYYREDGKNEERFQRLLGDGSAEGKLRQGSSDSQDEDLPQGSSGSKEKELLQGSSGSKEGNLWKESLGSREREMLASAILRYLGWEYARKNMVLQLHMGAQRRTSTRLRGYAGAAGGYAAIGNSVEIASLTEFLDDVEQTSGMGLPKVILFALNPADHGMLSSLAGSYAKDHVPGLVTQGPAWWWCDHGYGIRSVLENTAAYGLLCNFVGMTTDSRSFLSFARHDYFRRVLCGWIGERAAAGDMPDEPELLEGLVYNMCYGNARNLLTRA